MAEEHATKDQLLEAFKQGQLAGATAEQLKTLFGNQSTMLEKLDRLEKKLDDLNNWRWLVIGIAAGVSFLVSLMASSIKAVFK